MPPQICSRSTHAVRRTKKHLLPLCMFLLLSSSRLTLAQRNPSSGTSNGARGFGGVATTFRQKNNNDEKGDGGGAGGFGDGATNLDSTNNFDDFFGIDDTDFPSQLSTGVPTILEEDDALTPPTIAPTIPPSSAPVVQSTTAPVTALPTAGTNELTKTPEATVGSGISEATTNSSLKIETLTVTTMDPTEPEVNTSSPSSSLTTSVPTVSPTESPTTNEEIINATNVTTPLTDDLIGEDEWDGGEIEDPSVIETLEPTEVVEITDFPITLTESPTAFPPTIGPTVAAEHFVTGQISLNLGGLQDALFEASRMIFLATAGEFIGSATAGKVQGIRVMVIYQRIVKQEGLRSRRRLQSGEALQVDLGVEGYAFEDDLSEDEWNQWLRDLFNKRGIEFVNLLQEFATAEQITFFDPLVSVEALEPASLATPTLSPTRQVISPTLTTTNDGGDGLPLAAIIGAAAGGFVFLVLGILLIRFALKHQSKKMPSLTGKTNNKDDSINMEDTEDDVGRRNDSGNDDIQNKPSLGESSISSGLYTNNAMHNYNYGGDALRRSHEPDAQSQAGGTTAGDASVMSYAYSLEPGIEPSVAGGPNAVPGSGASAMSYSVFPGGESVTSGTSSFAFMKMPFGGMAGAANSPSSISGKPTTEIIAPPGKLGIVIDTTIDGPVVHKVNAGSPLEGKLKSGDVIVQIDDVDTRMLTASAITALMVKTANQRRKLTIVSC